MDGFRVDGQNPRYESNAVCRDQEGEPVRPVRPNFERPPIVEQAITVMFDELAGFSLGDFGLFWATIRDEFASNEAKPLIENQIETFQGFVAREAEFRILPQEVLPRCFYRNADGTEIIQVQANRFSFNWTKSNHTPYPRAETTVSRFRELFARFEEFVSKRRLGPINILQCEVVNVNIVAVADFEGGFADAGKVFRGAVPGPDIDFLQTESYVINTRHVIIKDGAPAGRLYSSLTPVIRVEDGQLAYRFELTARGNPTGDTGFLGFFDIARNAINAAFMEATTEWAHLHWGIEDAASTSN